MSSASQTLALPVMGSLIVLVNKRADWNVPVSYMYIEYMSPCSACGFSTKKTSKVNTILKVVIFKHSAILFRCSMICRWPEPNPFCDSKPELFSDIACLQIPYQPCIVLFRIFFSGIPPRTGVNYACTSMSCQPALEYSKVDIFCGINM
jgi:hypothetical protein